MSLAVGNYPPGLEESRKLELLELTKAGSTEAKDELILSHIRLAFSIVNRLHTSDNELKSAAVEGVVHAMSRVSKGHLSHDNVTGYIVHFIHQYIGEYIRKISSIPMPRGHTRLQAYSIRRNEAHYDPRAMTELKDLLAHSIETKQERRIVDLKIAGYTDAQVGEIMDIPQTRVFRIRQTLKQRFERLNNND